MKKKNAIGALVMAGMILVSVPLGTTRSFDRLREKAMEEYYYDRTGYSILDGKDRQTEAARNLITVAERYVERVPELDPYIDELTYRAEYCENFYDPGAPEEVEYYRLLRQAAEKLSERLGQVELDERDKKYPVEIMAEIYSEQDKLTRSSYNEEARKFNARLTEFPANLLRGPMEIEAMGVFEQE